MLYKLVASDPRTVLCTQNINHKAPPPKSQVTWKCLAHCVTCPGAYAAAKVVSEVQQCCEPFHWTEGVVSELAVSTSWCWLLISLPPPLGAAAQLGPWPPHC